MMSDRGLILDRHPKVKAGAAGLTKALLLSYKLILLDIDVQPQLKRGRE
jgi:hypothetical protein